MWSGGLERERRQEKETVNNIIIIRRSESAAVSEGTRPKTLPLRLAGPAQRGRCRTMADGAQVVA